MYGGARPSNTAGPSEVNKGQQYTFACKISPAFLPEWLQHVARNRSITV